MKNIPRLLVEYKFEGAWYPFDQLKEKLPTFSALASEVDEHGNPTPLASSAKGALLGLIDLLPQRVVIKSSGIGT